ncbi:MAG: VWA domain-containing protein [Myxococcales bacterium]|nr:VWA domain-containing protein [Myxococcales bacterium]
MRPGTALAPLFAPLLLLVAAPATSAMVLPDGGGAPLALRREVVSVQVDDQIARTTIDQVFENLSDRTVDGTYTFPLPDGAAVTGFATFVDGKRVESRMREKHAATDSYAAARRAGRSAALLEIGGPNRFTSRVANVAPGATRRVELRYDEVLRYDSGRVSWLLPLSLPGGGAAEVGELIVEATVRDQKEIGALTTPTRGVAITRVSPHEVRLRYRALRLAPVADLRVEYEVRSRDIGVHFAAHRPGGPGPGDGYFLLSFAPQEETEKDDRVTRDVVFVFDVSGSMAGKKIEQARRALLLCLANLHDGDRFNVIAFDDRVQAFRPEVVPVTAETLQAARTFASELSDRGGTDIGQALARALESFPKGGARPRSILFLTDGQATSGQTDTMQIVNDVMSRNGGDARIFTFGVGAEVNRELLERLATMNRGAASYIADSEGIDARVGAFYARVAEPLLANIAIDFGGREVKLVYPHTLPDLHKGLELVIAGRYAGAGPANAEAQEVVLRGDRNGVRKEYRARVRFPVSDERNPFVARLWARRRVEALLGQVRLEGETPERRAEIIALAEEWNIATPYTSFVADARQDLASLTPDRVQPGDPEIDVHAPANALGVTLIFPFGLTKAAEWEPRRAAWTCRFLVPRDTPDGVYAVTVVVTLPRRRVEKLSLTYVVDTTAPVMTLQVRGARRPGHTVELVARQVITLAELRTARGVVRRRADVRPDVKRLLAVAPDGQVVTFTEDRTGLWHARYRIPATTEGPLELKLRVVDIADNAREQLATIDPGPARLGSL